MEFHNYIDVSIATNEKLNERAPRGVSKTEFDNFALDYDVHYDFTHTNPKHHLSTMMFHVKPLITHEGLRLALTPKKYSFFFFPYNYDFNNGEENTTNDAQRCKLCKEKG